MDAEFWHERWDANEIGFHQKQGNALLKKHFAKLNLSAGSRVFIPLCGKTQDIAWLLINKYRVVGAELSEIAVKALFDELGMVSEVVEVGKLRHYRAENIDIFVGDIFDVSAELLGSVDAIYDRAALVALPLGMRAKYSRHMMDIALSAPQLIICFEYDQALQQGPPFSISEIELRGHYAKSYTMQCLERVPVEGGLKGGVAADEVVWQCLDLVES
jgi:thiopurine S-methyltransferase